MKKYCDFFPKFLQNFPLKIIKNILLSMYLLHFSFLNRLWQNQNFFLAMRGRFSAPYFYSSRILFKFEIIIFRSKLVSFVQGRKNFRFLSFSSNCKAVPRIRGFFNFVFLNNIFLKHLGNERDQSCGINFEKN